MEYRAVNNKLISEWRIMKYTKVRGCDVTERTIPALFWRIWDNHEDFMSVFRPVSESGISWTQGTCVIDWARFDLTPSNSYISYFRCPFFTRKLIPRAAILGHADSIDLQNCINRCRQVSLHGGTNGKGVITVKYVTIKHRRNTSTKGGIRHTAQVDNGGQ
jgi:hypothetical protein